MYPKLSLKSHLENMADRVSELEERIASSNEPYQIHSFDKMLQVNKKLIIMLASMLNEPISKYSH